MPTEAIIRAGIKEATKSDHDFRISAVLYKGGSILRATHNSLAYIGYRKREFRHKPTRHAEIMAVHNIPKDVLVGCSIFVCRLDNKGNFTCAKPCIACYQSLSLVKNIYYTDYDGNIKKLARNLDLDTYQKDLKHVCCV